MVLAIEPGIYWPGGGGLRLEDNFLITETGNEKLCSYPDDFRLKLWRGELSTENRELWLNHIKIQRKPELNAKLVREDPRRGSRKKRSWPCAAT